MITVVGSLNLDFFIETPHLPGPGETVLGHRFRQSPGGKGANQACAIGRLGGDGRVALIGAVGDDAFGREMTANLAKFDVDPAAIVVREKTASGVAFIAVDDSGRNQIIVSSGANATLTPDDIARHANVIRSSRILVAQLETPLPAVEAALRAARNAGVTTLLNPAPAVHLPHEVLELCDWIVLNETEAAILAGRSLLRPDEAPEVAAALRRRMPNAGILITLGAAGAWLDFHRTFAPVSAFRVVAIDTVGAGDTFVGAFAVKLSEGNDPFSAAEFASAAAALAVTRRGAQAGIPTRTETEQFLATATGASPADRPAADGRSDRSP